MEKFREGDLVLALGYIAEIMKIEDDTIITTTLGDFHTDKIFPIEIKSHYSKNIKSRSNAIMASYVDYNAPAPLYADHKYLMCQDICDIIKENDFKYIHELQHWLRENNPKCSLYY